MSVTLVHCTSLVPSVAWRTASKFVHCDPTIWSALYIELATVQGIPGRDRISLSPHCSVAATLKAISVASAYELLMTWLVAATVEVGATVLVESRVSGSDDTTVVGAAVLDGATVSGSDDTTVVAAAVVGTMTVSVSVSDATVDARLSVGTAENVVNEVRSRDAVRLKAGPDDTTLVL